MGAEGEVNSKNLVMDDGRSRIGNKLPQYIAALSVCLGSVAAGTVMGWTSNLDLTDHNKQLNDIVITKSDNNWIGSTANLGGLVMCFPIAYLGNLIGRKYACLSMTILFTIGWLLIIFANNLGMIIAGRFITGMAGGAFCVAAPTYTSEIAEKEIRGALGSYFQLLLTVGILLSNILGKYVEVKVFSIICLVVPLVFAVVFFFQPETPVYSLRKGNETAARQALRRLRGPHYDVDAEIKDLKEVFEEEDKIQISFRESFKKRSTKKSLIICFGLMLFQQLSGINAVIFFTGLIFKQAGSEMSFSPTIIVGIMQVGATLVSSLVIDKFGRRVLLMFSDFMMTLAAVGLAIFFTLKDRDVLDDDGVKSIGFLPVLALCVFIIVFSLGYGPIPWMISSEVVPAEIKSVVTSAAGTFNWLLAFLVTTYYEPLSDAVGSDTTFYLFAGISCVGTAYVFFMVPETKGKSLEDIQSMLNGDPEVRPKSSYDNKAFSPS